MEWLLKIVEGPMKGAEIALVEGVAVSFGSADDCDIVVQDATVPPKACEFEVGASDVKITVGTTSETLPPFEIRSFGTTSLAVGPVQGEWKELVKAAMPAANAAANRTDGTDGTNGTGGTNGTDETNATGADAAPRRHRLLTCCGGLVVFIILLAAFIFAAWYFWPRIAARCPQAESARLAATAWLRSVTSATNITPSNDSSQPTNSVSLADIAREHGLALAGNTLTGNLKRRTERLAIRALALSADPKVKFDLTDDETLRAAAGELLFACSDGALKVDDAVNRVVTVSGYAPSSAALEQAIRALNADVKGISRLDTSRVRVGGTAPAAVAKTPFVRETAPGEHPVVAIPAHTPNPPLPKVEKAREFPIAGILTVPYPCVVMRNGVRLVEGAQIGKVILVKIEADKLTLDDGGRKVIWKP